MTQHEGVNYGGTNYGNAPGSNFGHAPGSHFHGVVGTGAQQEELRRLIDQLLSVVARHQNELADPQGAGTAVELLREETAGEQRPNRLMGFLAMLTASAGGVTAISEAATKVRELLTGML
ncbi:hypothetical protein [Nonomuraea gerenzanensis]|uniref:Uncharacterized protein n=1 Tax=Nonomuraea gerenzanensis TaxID=93944 RepID=A0A1M4DZN5_9ACTN|nr:hypothetical protein [Nonomuraea gerenzanensis]UBU14323.1 hypothetical protein LCN96_04660 [Nonomuraea gerenzanensis]SBO92027.1 hypothetical protein BN4615_P1541 [Nonomuraea gerenzanensis]